MSEIIALFAETRAAIVEARQTMEGGGQLIGSAEINRRIADIQSAADASTDRNFIRTMGVVLIAPGGLDSRSTSAGVSEETHELLHGSSYPPSGMPHDDHGDRPSLPLDFGAAITAGI
jgi:hypothetical protein